MAGKNMAINLPPFWEISNLAFKGKWSLGAIYLIGIGFIVYPTVALLYFNPDYVVIGHESIAYRYFYLERMAMGEESTLWFPQGYLTSFLQKIIHYVINEFLFVDSDLRIKLQAFGLITHVIQALLLLALVFAAFLNKHFSFFIKTTFLMMVVMALYGFEGAGTYYNYHIPDYLQMNTFLIFLIVYCCLEFDRIEKVHRTQWIIAGVVIGISTLNKISLLPLSTLLLVPLISRGSQYSIGRLIVRRKIMVSMVAAVFTFLLIFFGFYNFDTWQVFEATKSWVAFFMNPGMEPSFWESGFVFHFLHYNYYLSVLGLLPIFFLALWSLRKDREGAWRAGLIGLVFIGLIICFEIIAVIKRPAGTTMYEVAIIFLCLTGILLGAIERKKEIKWCGYGLVGLWVVACLSTFDFESISNNFTSAFEKSEKRWKLHEDILSYSKPIVIVIPDNRYNFQSVEEILLKGFADSGSWCIRSGQKRLNTYYRKGIELKSKFACYEPNSQYKQNIVLVLFERTDFKPLKEQYPSIQRVLSFPGVSCREYKMSPVHFAQLCNIP